MLDENQGQTVDVQQRPLKTLMTWTHRNMNVFLKKISLGY